MKPGAPTAERARFGQVSRTLAGMLAGGLLREPARFPAVARIALRTALLPIVALPANVCVTLDHDTLDRLCLERIARFKRPKAYRTVDTLPRNAYGKVLKTALREWLAAERENPSRDSAGAKIV